MRETSGQGKGHPSEDCLTEMKWKKAPIATQQQGGRVGNKKNEDRRKLWSENYFVERRLVKKGEPGGGASLRCHEAFKKRKKNKFGGRQTASKLLARNLVRIGGRFATMTPFRDDGCANNFLAKKHHKEPVTYLKVWVSHQEGEGGQQKANDLKKPTNIKNYGWAPWRLKTSKESKPKN